MVSVTSNLVWVLTVPGFTCIFIVFNTSCTVDRGGTYKEFISAAFPPKTTGLCLC